MSTALRLGPSATISARTHTSASINRAAHSFIPTGPVAAAKSQRAAITFSHICHHRAEGPTALRVLWLVLARTSLRCGERERLGEAALRSCFLCSTVVAWTAFLRHQVSQLRIVRRGISPLLDRRVIVRRKTSPVTLHAIVQTVFAWSDEHRHGFRMHGQVYGARA
jgi:hypothetical protein